MAKTFTIVLSEQELQALSGLLDAGVKSVGLSGARAAVALLDKLERAVAEAGAVRDESGPSLKAVQ